MSFYLLKLLLWCLIAISQTLACLTSSNECVNELTTRVIAFSSKLQKLSECIAIIDERSS